MCTLYFQLEIQETYTATEQLKDKISKAALKKDLVVEQARGCFTNSLGGK